MSDQMIVLVDDEPAVTRSLSMVLLSHGFNDIVEFNDSRSAQEFILKSAPSVVICDLSMPHISGQELIESVRDALPSTALIVATAMNEVDIAVSCMRSGAQDYLVKPVKEEQLLASLRRVLEVRELRRENEELRRRLSDHSLRNPAAFSEMLTNSPAMHTVFEYMEVIAQASQPVLITGETGTGKELAARALHQLRGKGNFVAINVAGLDANAFSDSLFGHVRGAFTGADNVRKGLIETAGEGTVFLDEIGDLAPESQVKLLRLLQENEYHPLGADTPRHTRARFVLATFRNLEELAADDAFRTDLYYRLRQYHINLPPLRKRPEDVPMLAQHFLSIAATDLKIDAPDIPSMAIDLLCNYSFPGNIRELQALMNEAVAHSSGGTLPLDFLRQRLSGDEPNPMRADDCSEIFHGLATLPPLKNVRGLLVEEALQRCGGNQTLAAKLLGVTRQAISKHANKD